MAASITKESEALMSGSELYFVSKNPHKQEEARNILSPAGIAVIADHSAIDELQTIDTVALVRDKTLKAFQKIGRPLFVEHTGLYLDMLGGFPGGLTQIFWDSLKKDRFAQLFTSETEKASAKTYVGYVDGQRIHVFMGEVTGKIVSPREDHGFQWDCVFVPDGHEQTFSEMGAKKNEISMRRLALDKLRVFLEERT